ncbi:3-hydroxyacyl-ACP dehydratase FabZ family protein [Amorphus orientalis]|uniref:3-hydroxyacyl-[acyl-carrier-protein] dehydratase n=1 Tax=Amorphus orientalis TaxID=649198 RepID=A0AAE3VQU6_9HYPH|nr:3-hydroxyacyl-ACP dehydratase FabZ family protein [Amorphus orientalis]MDQ0316505.1 3-hydroxyacyl-[acyl-carrier-protein] dehydratase [Amorphus orientalis]
MRLEYFHMIDEVALFDSTANRVEARSTVPTESTVFEGHFPGHPLMPGVLLIETMAQASGYLIMAHNGFSRMPFLAGVKQGKLRTFVEPGTKLDISAVLTHDGSGFSVTDAEIKVDGRRVCDASLTFKTMAFPTPEFEAMMRRQAETIGLAGSVG